MDNSRESSPEGTPVKAAQFFLVKVGFIHFPLFKERKKLAQHDSSILCLKYVTNVDELGSIPCGTGTAGTTASNLRTITLMLELDVWCPALTGEVEIQPKVRESLTSMTSCSKTFSLSPHSELQP